MCFVSYCALHTCIGPLSPPPPPLSLLLLWVGISAFSLFLLEQHRYVRIKLHSIVKYLCSHIRPNRTKYSQMQLQKHTHRCAGTGCTHTQTQTPCTWQPLVGYAQNFSCIRHNRHALAIVISSHIAASCAYILPDFRLSCLFEYAGACTLARDSFICFLYVSNSVECEARRKIRITLDASTNGILHIELYPPSPSSSSSSVLGAGSRGFSSFEFLRFMPKMLHHLQMHCTCIVSSSALGSH